MRLPVEVTLSETALEKSVVSCANDLCALLERRIGTVDACGVEVDRVVDQSTRTEYFRVKLQVAVRPLEVRMTLLQNADVYIALAQTFDRAAWLIAKLRPRSKRALLRRISAAAVGLWRPGFDPAKRDQEASYRTAALSPNENHAD